MRAREQWRRQQEETIRGAMREAERLLAELAGPNRGLAIRQLAARAKELHLAAAVLDAEEKAPSPYARR